MTLSSRYPYFIR